MLTVHDVTGRVVADLLDDEQDGGEVTRVWNGKNQSGQDVAPGIYFVRLEAAGFASVRKVMRVR